MTYDQVLKSLQLAGFRVPRSQANSKPPVSVFWVHKLRRTTLVHGVFSLAAAAATRAGLSVHLLLDDVELPERERYRCDEFESQVREWIAFASGDDAKLAINLYSEVLTDEYLAARGWSAINDYLNKSTVLEILRASKTISPMQYDIDAAGSVLAILHNEKLHDARELLTPLRNWLVFETEIARILDLTSPGGRSSLVTLGGEDERILWDLWDRSCPTDLPERVQHIYLKPMPTPSYWTAWQDPVLSAEADPRSLTTSLVRRTAADGRADLLDWLYLAAVDLPASLNPAFREGLDPVLSEITTPLRAPVDQRTVEAVAEAVAKWLAPDRHST